MAIAGGPKIDLCGDQALGTDQIFAKPDTPQLVASISPRYDGDAFGPRHPAWKLSRLKNRTCFGVPAHDISN
jgi:hypothetical protein